MSIELYTEDRLVYNFYPVTSNTLSFRIKAPHDAHIILTENQYDSPPCYEIFFGGWKNTKSVIRKDKVQPDVVEVATPNILNANEYRGFWIRWEYGVITAGISGDLNPIIRYQGPPLPIRYFGICTGWGAQGHWIIDNTPPSVPYGVPPAGGFVPPAAMSYPQPAYNPGFVPPAAGIPPSYPGLGGFGFATPTIAPKWLSSSNGSVPPNAVVGGNDRSGEPIYVIRARHEGSLTPGKLVPSHRIAYIPWGGRENPKNEYEVLCDCAPRWVNAIGQIPPGAFAAGQSEGGETLYVGRAHHEGSLTIGKVQASHGVCYIPYGGEEVAKREYEILVI